MVDDQPKWRTGKLCYIEGRSPATDPGFLIYIMVADAEAAIDAVVNAGGQIRRQPGLAQMEVAPHG
jgi:predicted enzyme related to lactoylglutathione lyase